MLFKHRNRSPSPGGAIRASHGPESVANHVIRLTALNHPHKYLKHSRSPVVLVLLHHCQGNRGMYFCSFHYLYLSSSTQAPICPNSCAGPCIVKVSYISCQKTPQKLQPDFNYASPSSGGESVPPGRWFRYDTFGEDKKIREENLK